MAPTKPAIGRQLQQKSSQFRPWALEEVQGVLDAVLRGCSYPYIETHLTKHFLGKPLRSAVELRQALQADGAVHDFFSHVPIYWEFSVAVEHAGETQPNQDTSPLKNEEIDELILFRYSGMTGIDPSIFEAKRSSAFLTVKLAEIAKNDTWVMITGRNIEEKRSLRARLWALDGAKIKQEESTESTSPFHLAIHSGSNANTYTDSPNTFTEAPQIYDPDETEDETNPRIMNNGRSRFRPLAPTPRGQDPRETVSQSQIGIVINGGRRFTSSDVNETGRHRGMENMMTYGQSRSMALAPSSYGRRTDATGNVRNSVATLVGGSHFTPINARGRRTDATGNVRNSDATLVGGSHFTPINARDANVTAVRPTSLLGELDSVDRELLRESNSQTPQAEVPWNGGAGFHEESDASGDESSDFEIDDPPIITVTRPPGPDHAKDLANQVAEFLRRWAQRPASGLSAENEDRYFIKHARRWGMSVRKISESGVLQTGRTDPIGIEYRIRQMLHKGKDVRPRTDGFVWKRHQASLKTPSTPKALEIKKVKQAIFDGWSAQQIVDSGIITEGINIVPAVKHRWSSYLWRGYKFPPPC